LGGGIQRQKWLSREEKGPREGKRVKGDKKIGGMVKKLKKAKPCRPTSQEALTDEKANDSQSLLREKGFCCGGFATNRGKEMCSGPNKKKATSHLLGTPFGGKQAKFLPAPD